MGIRGQLGAAAERKPSGHWRALLFFPLPFRLLPASFLHPSSSDLFMRRPLTHSIEADSLFCATEQFSFCWTFLIDAAPLRTSELQETDTRNIHFYARIVNLRKKQVVGSLCELRLTLLPLPNLKPRIWTPIAPPASSSYFNTTTTISSHQPIFRSVTFPQHNGGNK